MLSGCRPFTGLYLAALIVAACTGAAAPSFDPTGPCTVDGRRAGAYPELESQIPKTLAGKPPLSLDSGRNCSAVNLATLANHGLTEVRFAGGVWTDGAQSAITLAIFTAPGLEADWMGEWYEAGARAARQTGALKTSRVQVGGQPANRLDLVNGDSSQTVITWAASPGTSGTSGTRINVVIAADEPESRIQQAIAAFP